jgi:hypothetical protein
MKRCALLVILIVVFFVPVPTFAGDVNFRLITHFVEDVGAEDGLGLSAWIIAPNLTGNSNKLVALVGPRHKAKNWWIELNGGVVVNDGDAKPLLDVRASFTKFKPFTFWTIVQWINPIAGSDAFYVCVQSDYWVIPKRFALGLETENLFRNGENVISYGPHLIIPVGKVMLVGVYQYHNDSGGDQVWIRTVFTF